MNYHLINIVIGLAGFILFAIIQAFIINGYKESLNEGMILYGFSKFIENTIKSEYWRKPITSCVRCLSSTIGAITFWPFVLIVFGWHWQEIFIYISDVFVLVYLSWYFYKRS